MFDVAELGDGDGAAQREGGGVDVPDLGAVARRQEARDQDARAVAADGDGAWLGAERQITRLLVRRGGEAQ